jgi:hypothetical protein
MKSDQSLSGLQIIARKALVCMLHASVEISINRSGRKLVVQHSTSPPHRYPSAPKIHTPVHATTWRKRNVDATTAMVFVAAVFLVVVRIAEACEVV